MYQLGWNDHENELWPHLSSLYLETRFSPVYAGFEISENRTVSSSLSGPPDDLGSAPP